MHHLVFLVYVLALIAGVACSANLFARRHHYQGLTQALTVNWAVGVFTVWGASVLYASANLVGDLLPATHGGNPPSLDYVEIFLAGAGIIIAAMVPLIARQTNAELSLGKARLNHFSLLGLLAALGSFALIMLGDYWRLVGVLIPVCALAVAISRDRYLSYRYAVSAKKGLITTSDSAKSIICRRLSAVLPLCYMAFGLAEGFLFGDLVVERGVTLSLPLIYLCASLALWWFVDQNFSRPEPEATPSENVHPRRPKLLTDKEFEVVSAVYQGLSNKQVADRLCMAPSTVKNHLYSVFKKLEVSNRVALIQCLRSEQN